MHGTLTSALAWAAQTATNTATSTGADQAAPTNNTGGPFLLMIAVIFILFYFIMLRPSRNEQKARDKQIEALAKGDQVVTAGGIHGTIEGIEVSTGIVSLSVAPKTTIRINKTSISSVTNKKNAPKSEKVEKSEGKAG